MKAKDTVMRRDEIGLTVSEIHKEEGESIAQWNWSTWREIAEAQAEISFKAGAKEGYDCGVYNGHAEGLAEGIKEVVDWSTGKCGHKGHHGEPFIRKGAIRRECYICWQAKLKEWGIE